VPCFWAVLAALCYSRCRTVRLGVHHGLEWVEGREQGVCSFRRPVRLLSKPVSHLSRDSGEGQEGVGGL